MCKAYDSRVNLALLPFYLEKISFIKEELTKKRAEGAPKKEIRELKRLRDFINKDFEREKTGL
jgi:hypothetical protein